MLKKIFFFILFLGLLGSFLTKDIRFSPYENRNLQMFPKFSFKSLLDSSFAGKIDTYVSDQFVFRNQWIRFKTLTDKNLFQKNTINNVYLSKNQSLMNRYTALDYSQKTLAKNIELLNSFSQTYNAQVILVPTASEVLTDNLPASYHINQEMLLNDVSTDFSALSILKEHSDERIYFTTDHHWTLLGAYYIYEKFVETPLPFEAKVVSDSFYGTIFRKINLPTPPDSLEKFESRNTFHVIYDNAKTSYSLYNDDALSQMDQYPYYLDGNHATTQIINETIDSNNSLLIIKDSFGNSFATLIANHYKNVYLLDLRYFNGNVKDYIEENDIDEILFLYNNINFMQDRNLGKLP